PDDPDDHGHHPGHHHGPHGHGPHDGPGPDHGPGDGPGDGHWNGKLPRTLPFTGLPVEAPAAIALLLIAFGALIRWRWRNTR
ncbi:hypothetical protein HII36_21545, partial [Nonomuraea sp. NN258]